MQIGRTSTRGSAYLVFLLVLIVAMAAAVPSALLGATANRRFAEAALWEAGFEYMRAIRSYQSATITGQESLPRSLDDLLLDPRSLTTRRHLRKVYVDPISGTKDWVLERNSSGYIVGVTSPSEQRPIKTVMVHGEYGLVVAASSYRQICFCIGKALGLSKPYLTSS